MTMLTIRTAQEYAASVLANSAPDITVISACHDEDGGKFVRVQLSDGFEMDVWIERRADGSEYLYGEW